MSKPKPSIDSAAALLRELSLKAAQGDLIGSEDDIVVALGVSRVTARQAARLLEREGVLRVKRGKKGGYFSNRPDVQMVETVVCAYLEQLGLKADHTGTVSTALWVEALREASNADRAGAIAVAARFAGIIQELDAEATLEEVARLEREIRAAIFELIDGAYIGLLFRINAAFARQRLKGQSEHPDPEHHRTFVRKWKMAKLMELEAIAEGSELLAMSAAFHTRSLWIGRGSYPRRRSAALKQ